MDKEENNWRVNIVKARYEYLNLTFEQAEIVYRHEEDKLQHSNKHLFSDWEDWDYDLTVFRNILNKKQLRIFEKVHDENIRRYEQGLIEQDEPREIDINYNHELIEYYEQTFHAYFF